jgi:hypothetical protein
MEKICYKCENYPICKNCIGKEENYCKYYDEPLPRAWLNEEALESVENYESALKIIEEELGFDAADYTRNLCEKLTGVEACWQFMDIISNAVKAGLCSIL